MHFLFMVQAQMRRTLPEVFVTGHVVKLAQLTRADEIGLHAFCDDVMRPQPQASDIACS